MDKLKTKNTYSDYLANKKYFDAIEPALDELINSWIAYIESVKQSKPSHLQQLLKANIEYKQKEFDLRKEELWQIVSKKS